MMPAHTDVMEVHRLDPDVSIEDRGDDVFEIVQSNVKCHVSSPGGSTTFAPERTSTSMVMRLTSEITDIQQGDRVKIRGVFYDVLWAHVRLSGPMPHVSAQIQITKV